MSCPTRFRLTVAAVWFASTAHLLLLPDTSSAVSIDWDNGSGDGNWNTPTNWVGDGIPSGGNDAVFIANVGPASITADIPVLRDIRFGDEFGRVGTGTVNHSAGVAQLNGWFRSGLTGGSSGTYNLSGTSQLIASSYRIGESTGASSTINISGGELRQSDVADVGFQNGWSRLAEAGSVDFVLSSGTASFDSRLLVGGTPTSSATITQTGGIFEVRRGEAAIADQSSNVIYNISGGTLQTLSVEDDIDRGGHITIGQWDNSNGQMNVSGSAQVSSSLDFSLGGGQAAAPSQGTVTQTGGTVTVGGNLLLAATRSFVAGVEDPNGNPNQTGTYHLQGGTLNLTGGSIVIGDGTGAFNFTGGRLEDVLSVNFSLAQQGGTLSVGGVAAAGVMTVSGNYTLSLLGTLQLELIAAGFADQLDVNGAVALNNGVLEIMASSGLAVGNSFIIIDNDGDPLLDPIAGIFAGRPEGSSFFEDGYQFRISYLAGDGNDVALTLIAVPEPSLAGLAVCAAGATLLTRRRRRRSS